MEIALHTSLIVWSLEKLPTAKNHNTLTVDA
jgi:hypothetical protein